MTAHHHSGCHSGDFWVFTPLGCHGRKPLKCRKCLKIYPVTAISTFVHTRIWEVSRKIYEWGQKISRIKDEMHSRRHWIWGRHQKETWKFGDDHIRFCWCQLSPLEMVLLGIFPFKWTESESESVSDWRQVATSYFLFVTIVLPPFTLAPPKRFRLLDWAKD